MFSTFAFGSGVGWVPTLILVLDVLTALGIFYYTFKHKYYWIGVLEFIQVALVLWFEKSHGHGLAATNPFIVDKFAWIMLLIVAIVGGLIVVFAKGYMEEYQREHPEVQDRRPFFFGVMAIFLVAMFGLVSSNNLMYMYTCWEITSFCSFLLIGYTQTPEATRNSFKALWMNLLGGLAFAIAIYIMGTQLHTVELTKLLSMGDENRVVLLVAALLVFCGFTKCAMMPFSGWLLGAMVAPTPTSALLHSSTMVKAGVFLIIKLCPLFSHNFVGWMTLMVGGITFFFAACAAISQSDGKKVLAYSTISNLGLIVCCAGLGTYAGAWTAMMLVIFHAVAKSLCFLCVGTAEQQIGSRNLENFDGLFCSMPRLSMCMLTGICGMFLAPFGMLMAKWAAMKAVVDAGQPLLVLLMVFGSAVTMFYWAKWIGKLCAYIPAKKELEQGIHTVQWVALHTLSTLVVVLCVGVPVISRFLVVPYLATFFRGSGTVLSQINLLVMGVMVLVIVLLPLGYGRGRENRQVVTQLSGANTGDNMSYEGAAGRVIPVTLSNWYMEEFFGEKKMQLWGFSLCLACILAGLALTGGGVLLA